MRRSPVAKTSQSPGGVAEYEGTIACKIWASPHDKTSGGFLAAVVVGKNATIKTGRLRRTLLKHRTQSRPRRPVLKAEPCTKLLFSLHDRLQEQHILSAKVQRTTFIPQTEKLNYLLNFLYKEKEQVSFAMLHLCICRTSPFCST